MELSNWYYATPIFTFLGVWFFVIGMLTDDTPTWKYRHYFYYMMVVILDALEMSVIMYLAKVR